MIKRPSISFFSSPDDGSLEPKRYNIDFLYIKFFPEITLFLF